VPNSTLVEYFNSRLNELADNDKVVEIKTAKLVLMNTPPPVNAPIDYLYSQHILNPSSILYHVCQVIVSIQSATAGVVDCNIVYYDNFDFLKAIDDTVDEGLSRCFRYF